MKQPQCGLIRIKNDRLVQFRTLFAGCTAEFLKPGACFIDEVEFKLMHWMICWIAVCDEIKPYFNLLGGVSNILASWIYQEHISHAIQQQHKLQPPKRCKVILSLKQQTKRRTSE